MKVPALFPNYPMTASVRLLTNTFSLKHTETSDSFLSCCSMLTRFYFVSLQLCLLHGRGLQWKKSISDKLNCEESTIMIWAGSDGLANDSKTLGQEQYANPTTTVHFQHHPVTITVTTELRTFNWWITSVSELTGCDNQVYDISCFIYFFDVCSLTAPV